LHQQETFAHSITQRQKLVKIQQATTDRPTQNRSRQLKQLVIDASNQEQSRIGLQNTTPTDTPITTTFSIK
jgi:hypothetical protein